MTVIFENLNNSDINHDIVFLSITKYANSKEKISVLFDGLEYASEVCYKKNGDRYFRHCGKIYDFEIVVE